MASPRRIGAPDAKDRAVLLDTAEQLMLEEGYAAVTSRRLAGKAGLKSQLVHYYFRTMDELFLAVFQRRAEEGLQRQAEALASDQPLWALWGFLTDTVNTALTMEFIALTNHRKMIQTEIARYAERFRVAQVEALSSAIERYQIPADAFPPDALVVLMTSISRVMVMEKTQLGMALGHAETVAFVERWLQRLEGDRKSEKGSPAATKDSSNREGASPRSV